MNYKEYLVKRKLGAAERLVTVLLYFGAFMLALCCLYYLRVLGGAENLLAVGAFYLAYVLASRLKKEFEYIIVEDSLDIDVIFNASKRKNLISFSVKQIEVMAAITDEKYNGRLKENFDKVIDASTWKKGALVYFAILENKGQKTIVKFEPSLSCLEYMKKYAPDKIHISEAAEDNEFE
ncbi:MAG: hypothetical protein IKV89_02945 [Clostridia bacterium]|nr:hypothetical protein [Clostridia bacterium]